MNNNIHPAPAEIEVVADHVPSNSFEVDAEIAAPNTPKRVPLPKKTRVIFLLSYSVFFISFLIFFLVVSYTYPLKPEQYMERFRLPVFENISAGITNKTTGSVFFDLIFHNRNNLIPVSYDFLNITVSYWANYTDQIYLANTTLAGFKQHRANVVQEIEIAAPGLPDLIQSSPPYWMSFQVDLEFNMKYHCRELGKHKHRLALSTGFYVSSHSGLTYRDTYMWTEISS